MLILRSSNLATLQLFLRNITEAADRIRAQNKSGFYPAEIAQNIFSEGVKMATVFLVIAPIMMVYPFLQKYFAKGIMIGAVKM